MYRSPLRGQEFEQVFPYFCAVRCSGGVCGDSLFGYWVRASEEVLKGVMGGSDDND